MSENEKGNNISSDGSDNLFVFKNAMNAFEGLEVILCVKGQLIKGTLVGPAAYFHAYNECIKVSGKGNALHAMTKFIDEFKAEIEDLQLKKIGEFIHLTDVSVLHATGWLSISYPWRGRISSIDGYM